MIDTRITCNASFKNVVAKVATMKLEPRRATLGTSGQPCMDGSRDSNHLQIDCPQSLDSRSSTFLHHVFFAVIMPYEHIISGRPAVSASGVEMASYGSRTNQECGE